MKTNHIILLTSIYLICSALAAEEVIDAQNKAIVIGMFKLAAKVVVLPMKEFPAQPKLDGLITDGVMHSFLRDLSQIDNAKMASTPSVVVQLNKAEQIEIVSEKTVTRIGTANDENIGSMLTYRLTSNEGVFTLDGIFKHSEIIEIDKPSVVAINTEEIIFKRVCELDKSILVSQGDTHIFITLTRAKKE